MHTHILYIPGLGDHYDPFRRWCLGGWKLWGVSSELVPITWYDGGTFEQKYELVRQRIDAANGKRVVLIGESAGATLALHAAHREPAVSKLITLCGVTQATTPIAGYLRRRAPALDVGVNTLKDDYSLPIDSVRAWTDTVVGRRYSVVKGAREHVLPTIGHFITIVTCLTILSWYIVRLAKKPN